MVKASMITKVDANMKIVVFYGCPRENGGSDKTSQKDTMSQAARRSQMEHMNSDKVL
jgi:hypothetical protein